MSKNDKPARDLQPLQLHVPIGIEKVLYQASADPDFRAALFNQRQHTLGQPELALSESEQRLLSSISDTQLSSMIARIDPQAHARSPLMRTVTNAVIAAATSASLVACLPMCGGAREDWPQDVVEQSDDHDTLEEQDNVDDQSNADKQSEDQAQEELESAPDAEQP
ncbi:MAG: hypothetical protein RBU37_00995 [Myxococcota bacterium]|jgi:hypothetical protein|nr:hypothetical protein [Myxococcota bacterium]